MNKYLIICTLLFVHGLLYGQKTNIYVGSLEVNGLQSRMVLSLFPDAHYYINIQYDYKNITSERVFSLGDYEIKNGLMTAIDKLYGYKLYLVFSANKDSVEILNGSYLTKGVKLCFSESSLINDYSEYESFFNYGLMSLGAVDKTNLCSTDLFCNSKDVVFRQPFYTDSVGFKVCFRIDGYYSISLMGRFVSGGKWKRELCTIKCSDYFIEMDYAFVLRSDSALVPQKVPFLSCLRYYYLFTGKDEDWFYLKYPDLKIELIE